VSKDEMPDYTGRIRAAGKDKIRGWMVDRLGCRIVIEGVRDTAGGGYLLTGTVDIPGWLAQPADKETPR
jgi:hypothetical protein